MAFLVLGLVLVAAVLAWSRAAYRAELGYSGGVINYRGPERRAIEPPSAGATGSRREAAATVTVNLATTGRMTVPLAFAGLVVLLLGARAVRYGQWSRPVSTLGWVPPPRRRARWPLR